MNTATPATAFYCTEDTLTSPDLIQSTVLVEPPTVAQTVTRTSSLRKRERLLLWPQ
jgi:hypothetical protein